MLQSAYIVPHPPIILSEIGQGEERKIQNTIDAYHTIAKEISKLKPETIVIISSHAPSYSDYIHISPGQYASGDFSKFHHPECRIAVEYDTELVDRISSIAKRNRIDAGKRGDSAPVLDHGTMIPLYFINQYYENYRVVRVSVSGLSAETHDLLGQCISAAADDLERNIVVIASGDLSHRLSEASPYGQAKEGKEFDQFMLHAMRNNELASCANVSAELAKKSAQCGLPAFQILQGCLREYDFMSELMSYEHPFGIGYAICAFREFDQDPYIHLARTSLRYYLKHHKPMKQPEGLDAAFYERAGVFVSLYKNDELRGCMGSVQPIHRTLGEEIIQTAVAAALHDPRFPPVTNKELSQLELHVDVLSHLEPVFFPDELDVKQYGIIVSSSGKRGVLLPNIKEITTSQQQLQIALEKAGISKDDFYTIERFRVEHH